MRALLVVALLATNAHAIVGGTPSTDPAVVALVRGEGATTELVCSGTVIAPHAVLTAAHCVTGTLEVLVGNERLVPIATFVAPGFDATTLANDVAIVVFDRALAVAAKPLAMAPPPVGATMQLVGFGRTAPDDLGPFEQRTGDATIAESAPTGIVSHGPAFTCEGDSGGPALVADVVVGVTSSGDAACAEHSRHVRISDHLTFIEAVVAKTAQSGAQIGDRCWYASNCAQSECRPALDEPRLSFCTTDCVDGTCPAGLACIADECRHRAPSPGAFGSSCELDEDCIDALCLAPAGEDTAACTQRCFSDLPGFACPADTTCEPASDDGEACFARAENGCCSGSPSPSLALALLVLAQLLRGRGRP